MEIDLGRRIKFFRKRFGISQLELETGAGLAGGMISRIENNQVNPTKETVLSIAKVLDLSNKEISYLIGITASPATQEEINKAKKEVNEVLNQRGKLAYLLDDRWRFQMISNTFMKFLKMTEEELDYVIGKTTAQAIVEPNSPVMSWVDEKFRVGLINSYLLEYYSEMSYMEDDEIYRNTVTAILKNPVAKKIWANITTKKYIKYTPEEDAVIHFNVLGFKIPLYYSGRPLPQHSRFEIVEFHTGNKILDLLPSLI